MKECIRKHRYKKFTQTFIQGHRLRSGHYWCLSFWSWQELATSECKRSYYVGTSHYLTHLLVCDLNRTPNCYGKTWRFLCPFFRNLHLLRTSRETVSHPQCPPLPTLCKISLPIYVIVTNKLLQPLTTTWYDSLMLSFSLLKINDV